MEPHVMAHDDFLETNATEVFNRLRSLVVDPWLKIEGFKIGRTNDVNRRAKEHKDSYDTMYVLYKANTLADANSMETYLIERSAEFSKNENEEPGGGGNDSDPPHFVYVVFRTTQLCRRLKST